MSYSDEDLLTSTVAELRRIQENCRRHAENPSSSFHRQATEALAQIDRLGLHVPEREITLDSPVGRTMERIIFSAEGKAAALAAAREGKSPMAVIDPMLQNGIGAEYRPDNGATVQAGYLVRKMMEQNLWEVDRRHRANLPEHCIAKTAALYVYIPSKR